MKNTCTRSTTCPSTDENLHASAVASSWSHSHQPASVNADDKAEHAYSDRIAVIKGATLPPEVGALSSAFDNLWDPYQDMFRFSEHTPEQNYHTISSPPRNTEQGFLPAATLRPIEQDVQPHRQSNFQAAVQGGQPRVWPYRQSAVQQVNMNQGSVAVPTRTCDTMHRNSTAQAPVLHQAQSVTELYEQQIQKAIQEVFEQSLCGSVLRVHEPNPRTRQTNYVPSQRPKQPEQGKGSSSSSTLPREQVAPASQPKPEDDSDQDADVDPDEDDDVEVVIGPKLAVSSGTLRDYALPNMQEKLTSVSIQSSARTLTLSDCLRLSKARGAICPLSFGSVQHFVDPLRSTCRPCMYERWAGRCARKWLCDFCHIVPHNRKLTTKKAAPPPATSGLRRFQ
eukprot:gnl/TRDRNA2_/TRDRNA2_205301_c0_seq1.p1 gnl/TRDRNA2_/TRDRNA2_205301_c0~~gnl/TRDRNA2_/TRDRNA2_205301_c0_seq1.p1  ORF type:complete len:395 (-),score=39.00 gnl/TRDRNA2_/TRDRNA2_205301_c0_seq1:149-1333(-)